MPTPKKKPIKAQAQATKNNTKKPTPTTNTPPHKPGTAQPENDQATQPTTQKAATPTPKDRSTLPANLTPTPTRRQTPPKGEGKQMRVGRGRTVVKPLPDGRDPTEGGTVCGAQLPGRPGVFCRQKAGARTDHVGEGRCWLHGGLTPARSGGRYSSITSRPRIAELLAKFEGDPNPLDLAPEAILLRAMVLDFIERYDEMHAGLMRWQMSFDKAFASDYSKWLRDMRRHIEGGGLPDDEGAPTIPDPLSYVPKRPVTIIDITGVSSLVAQIGALVDRINKMKEDKTFSMATIGALYETMAADLVTVAQEHIDDDSRREALLDAVERRWRGIQLSRLTGPRAGPQS